MRALTDYEWDSENQLFSFLISKDADSIRLNDINLSIEMLSNKSWEDSKLPNEWGQQLRRTGIKITFLDEMEYSKM